MKRFKTESGQAGFSLLGVLLAVMIIGVLATIAVPKFSSAVAMANTAKVQNDLVELDSAIAVYQMENGRYPTKLSDLSDYVADLENLKPPQGTCYLKTGKTVDITDTAYSLTNTDSNKAASETDICRAVCAGHVAGDFGK